MQPPEESSRTHAVEVALTGADWELRARVAVPAGPARQRELLPLARSLADAIVGQAVHAAEEAGTPVSCRAGCGACCRQLVAISEVEARRLREVVESLPEPRRSQVRARFADARRRLDEAGLLSRLLTAGQWTPEEYTSLTAAYFALGVACPFLEDESCSIYAERPVTCREYLVTSPAEHCARPTADTVHRLRIPLRVFNALARWEVPPSAHFLERWVPLVLALEWAQAHPDEPPPRPGPDLLRELLAGLSDPGTPPAPDEAR
jgi:Fe-S-cluster containining protein